ncbi:ABC transporter permease [Geodermatophilus sp. CPCC 206100]|uniref:ABC transporter permease n=1 Tax=Geodermatophilus sp. CPCC 206100 TaxID=3020054 RepID=UPI003B008AAA
MPQPISRDLDPQAAATDAPPGARLAGAGAAGGGPGNAVRRRRPSLHAGRSAGILIGLVAVCVYLGITQPVFLTWGNVTNIVQSNSVILVLALGATFVIIAGGIDLSAASALAVTGMVLAIGLEAGLGTTLSLLLTLAAGLLAGLVNGALISYLRISFLVVTLGTLSIFASLALVLNDGQTITTFGLEGFDPIYAFTLESVAGIPYVLIFDVAIVALGGFLLRYTAFGRAVFALGSNREAARLNGINVAATTLLVYVIAGLAAGLASVLSVGRLTAAAPTQDATLLLTVIAAVLIGGTAYTGGEGGVLGTVVGVLFLGVIQNGLTLASVSPYWRGTVNGLVLIVAVGIGVMRETGVLARLRRRHGGPVRA